MDSIARYKLIFNNVYCRTYRQTCYVFLCGGAEKKHIRNAIRIILEKMNYRVLYPEDLFIEMMNKNKSSNLLEYENLLAENADVICIICESMGSAVELGAFVQSESIKSKLVVVLDKKYSRDKSFIMLGPVKHLQKYRKDRVILYKPKELDKLAMSLNKVFKGINRSNINTKTQSFNELSQFIAFIPIVVFFYSTIKRTDIHKDLKRFISSIQTLPTNYKDLFNAAIKYLLKSGALITKYSQSYNGEIFALSTNGYAQVLETLSFSSQKNKTILHDQIRCDILKEQLNN